MVFDLARELAKKPLNGGNKENELATGPLVDADEGLDVTQVRLGYDAQTSGGLLATVPADAVDVVVKELLEEGAMVAAVIGEVTEGPTGRIKLSPSPA